MSNPLQNVEVGKSFSSFSEFEKCLRDFKEKNNHPLHVFNSQTAKNYNSKHPADHVDEERFLHTYYSIRCVHYGEPRHRGKRIRCHQQSFAMKCPVKITVTFDKVEQKLKIRDSVQFRTLPSCWEGCNEALSFRQ